jgi:hypothetical protein
MTIASFQPRDEVPLGRGLVRSPFVRECCQTALVAFRTHGRSAVSISRRAHGAFGRAPPQPLPQWRVIMSREQIEPKKGDKRYGQGPVY